MILGRVLHQCRPRPFLSAPYSIGSTQLAAKLIGQVAQEQIDDTGAQVAYKNFFAGRTVKPHDFTPKNRVLGALRRAKPLLVGSPSVTVKHNDPFFQFQLDPLSLIAHPFILSNYVTEMGKIKPRNITGLTVKSQRRLGKAIRRAKMMGIIPNLSKISFETSRPSLASR